MRRSHGWLDDGIPDSSNLEIDVHVGALIYSVRPYHPFGRTSEDLQKLEKKERSLLKV